MSSLIGITGGYSLEGAKVTINAYVGERFLNLIYHGYSKAYILGSRVKLSFLGSSPQIFKPVMPLVAYIAISYHNGSPLSPDRLSNQTINIRPICYSDEGTITLPTRSFTISTQFHDVWKISIDLKTEPIDFRKLASVKQIKLEASYQDYNHMLIKTYADFYSSYTPSNKVLQVSTSTLEPKVGEYIIFLVRANYYVDLISYAIVSKGVILSTGQEKMHTSLKTFSVTLSPEMAPSSTIVVYSIAKGGQVIVDSLTFSVDGISQNNFSISLNNRKDKTGDTIEVIVLGQPGTYVGLSVVDKDIYALDTSNHINHADVLKKMSTFDQQLNGTLSNEWISREGVLDRFIHFPSPSYGIDANRTFEVRLFELVNFFFLKIATFSFLFKMKKKG